MRHPFRIREIAAQAGLSEATVDRVLHGRGGVRESTVREVSQAIEDLDRQRSQVRLGGRTFMVDVIVQAPPRFSGAVRAALEAELPALRPAVVRSRFHLLDGPSVGDVVAALDRVRRGRSHGVILKAPDVPEIVAAAGRLDVPLVTLVTDLPRSPRVTYVGLDNRAAGATAAYLIQQWLGDRAGDVLVVRGHGSFRGEDERERGFRTEMNAWGVTPARAAALPTQTEADLARGTATPQAAALPTQAEADLAWGTATPQTAALPTQTEADLAWGTATPQTAALPTQAEADVVWGAGAGVPARRIFEVVDAEDRADAVYAGIRELLSGHPSVRAVYSLYAGAGGNDAVVAAFAAQGRSYDVFVAHDLDLSNTALLRERKLSAVLHHDLRTDMRRACHAIMQAQGALPGPIRTNPSAVQVITPHNAPPVVF